MSDKTTTIQDLKDRVRKFREERGWMQTDQKDIAISIVLEAAEILEHFQYVKSEDVQDSPKWRQAVGEEIADVIFLIMEMVDRYEIDLAEAFAAKVAKQEKKYPKEVFRPGMSMQEQMKEYFKVKAKTRVNHPFAEEDDKE